jgi:3-(3-hydroxy-phenyl)propionate hydroxylase
MTSLTGDDIVVTVLGARPGETWLVRPDAHVGAVLAAPAEVPDAVRRVLATP